VLDCFGLTVAVNGSSPGDPALGIASKLASYDLHEHGLGEQRGSQRFKMTIRLPVLDRVIRVVPWTGYM